MHPVLCCCAGWPQGTRDGFGLVPGLHDVACHCMLHGCSGNTTSIHFTPPRPWLPKAHPSQTPKPCRQLAGQRFQGFFESLFEASAGPLGSCHSTHHIIQVSNEVSLRIEKEQDDSHLFYQLLLLRFRFIQSQSKHLKVHDLLLQVPIAHGGAESQSTVKQGGPKQAKSGKGIFQMRAMRALCTLPRHSLASGCVVAKCANCATVLVFMMWCSRKCIELSGHYVMHAFAKMRKRLARLKGCTRHIATCIMNTLQLA